MSAMASQITCVSIVYSAVSSGADQSKHQSSASLAFVRGIHRWPANSPHKGSATRKLFHLMTSSCYVPCGNTETNVFPTATNTFRETMICTHNISMKTLQEKLILPITPDIQDSLSMFFNKVIEVFASAAVWLTVKLAFFLIEKCYFTMNRMPGRLSYVSCNVMLQIALVSLMFLTKKANKWRTSVEEIIFEKNFRWSGNIVNSKLRNKLQWNLMQNSYSFLQENTFQNVVCETATILTWLNVWNLKG